MSAPLFLGIDIGTQGARVVMIDVQGNVAATAGETFALSEQSREEQSPQEWWSISLNLIKAVVTRAKADVDLTSLRAISVTSTSGTVIPLDVNQQPLHNAIMYSDKRSEAQGSLCRKLAMEYAPDGYTGFNSSSGLSKMVWFVERFPGKAILIHRWVHAADFIIGKLSGRWGITDYTNVLKSGYDLRNLCWPGYLFQKLPLVRAWFPEVVAPGTVIGYIDPSLAHELGLTQEITVVAGMTDGCASQIASGAVHPGEWNTTIGTTLVIKGVTREEIKDPQDRIYSHRHPEGFWMPGGAGNIGADWVTSKFGEDLSNLTKEALQLIPTGHFAYPLQQQGERFPFVAPHARGFAPTGLSKAALFAANMEGVAYVERLAFETIQGLTGEKINRVFTAGGASNNDTWLKIRSNILNQPLIKMRHVTGAAGAAILAASKTHFPSIFEAVKAMTQVETQVQPEPKLAAVYERYYQTFVEILQEKGFTKAMSIN
ncbi:carbohydrate kinase [Segetibacter sp. 3557_3]|nr:carbohydrate kinase [Segetibacter sp. 3557_3]